MDLLQLQEKLEIKNDINNLIGIKLVDKYGRSLNDAINFVKQLSVIFLREPNYPLYITEEHNKLINYILLIENKYATDLIKAKTSSIKEKLSNDISDYKDIKKMNRLRDESINKEMNKTGYKYAPSLNIQSYPQMINVLYEECKILNNVLKKDSYLPSVSEAKDRFLKFNDYARNIDFIMTFKLIDNLYRESPLLQFCFDEKFLLLSNYILESNVDSKTKDKIAGLTKNIINTSLNIKSNKFFNGDVNLEEYVKLSKHTLDNIKEYEVRREEEKEKEKEQDKEQEKKERTVSIEKEFSFSSPAIYTTIKKKIKKKIFN